MKKTIIVCSTAKFPDGDAGSIYYSNLAKCLSDNLDEILLVGAGETKYLAITKDEKSGLDIISLRNYKKGLLSRLISHFTIKKKLIRYVYKHCQGIKLLVMDGTFSLRQYKSVCRFFKRHSPKTKIAIGILERYQKEEFENRLLTFKMIKNNNDFIDNFKEKNCQIICISSYLEKIFKDRGFKCLRVPFIFDSDQCVSFEQKRSFLKNDKKIRFIYAGSPSKKDLLDNIIIGLSLVPASYLQKIEVFIIGTTEKWLLNHGVKQETIERVSNNVRILGRLPHSEVEKYYTICDYSLLVRDEETCFSQAGFPTKISESLFYCTIPVTNLTSDLRLYLKDGVNSIIVDGHAPEDVSRAVMRAVDCFPDGEKLRNSVNSTLVTELSVQRFSTIIKEFLSL